MRKHTNTCGRGKVLMQKSGRLGQIRGIVNLRRAKTRSRLTVGNLKTTTRRLANANTCPDRGMARSEENKVPTTIDRASNRVTRSSQQTGHDARTLSMRCDTL